MENPIEYLKQGIYFGITFGFVMHIASFGISYIIKTFKII